MWPLPTPLQGWPAPRSWPRRTMADRAGTACTRRPIGSVGPTPTPVVFVDEHDAFSASLIGDLAARDGWPAGYFAGVPRRRPDLGATDPAGGRRAAAPVRAARVHRLPARRPRHIGRPPAVRSPALRAKGPALGAYPAHRLPVILGRDLFAVSTRTPLARRREGGYLARPLLCTSVYGPIQSRHVNDDGERGESCSPPDSRPRCRWGGGHHHPARQAGGGNRPSR